MTVRLPNLQFGIANSYAGFAEQLSHIEKEKKKATLEKQSTLYLVEEELATDQLSRNKYLLQYIFSFISTEEWNKTRPLLICKQWKKALASEKEQRLQCHELIVNTALKNSKASIVDPRFFTKEEQLAQYTLTFKKPFSWDYFRFTFLDLVQKKDEATAKWWCSQINRLYTLNQVRLSKLHSLDPNSIEKQKEFDDAQNKLTDALNVLKKRATEELTNPATPKSLIDLLQALLEHWNALTVFVDWPEVPMQDQDIYIQVEPQIAQKPNSADITLDFNKFANAIFVLKVNLKSEDRRLEKDAPHIHFILPNSLDIERSNFTSETQTPQFNKRSSSGDLKGVRRPSITLKPGIEVEVNNRYVKIVEQALSEINGKLSKSQKEFIESKSIQPNQNLNYLGVVLSVGVSVLKFITPPAIRSSIFENRDD